jgi:hypothetical protein
MTLKKGIRVTLAPSALYPTNSKFLIALFDLRCPGAEQRLRRELAGWCGAAHAEGLVAGRAVLVMRPGGALGLSR